MGVTVTKDIVADVLRRVKELTKSEVLIGIPDANAERSSDEGDKTPITNAGIGYVMEFGSPAQNIPARPFLIPGVENMRDAAIARLKVAGDKALSGQKSDIEKELAKVGILGQSAVRAKITDGPFQPLAPRTIKAREARGRTGIKPLIDTGQLRQSVSFVVRQKGKDDARS